MRLLHAQIYGALVSVLVVAALLWSLNLRREVRQLRHGQTSLRAQLRERPAKSAAKPRAQDGASRRLQLDLTAACDRVERAEAELAQLRRENGALRAAFSQKLAASGVSTAGAGLPGVPTAARPGLGGPPGGVGRPGGIDQPPGPPPVVAPPPAPRSEPWGASSASEIDEMAKVLKLNAQQTEELRKITMDSQYEFERRLIEMNERGDGDMSAFEEIANEMSKKAEQRIRQMLYPEQRSALDRYLSSPDQP